MGASGAFTKVLIKISGKSIPCKPSYTNLQHSQRCCPGFSNDKDQTRCVSRGNITAGAKWLFLKFYSFENRIHKSHREIPEELNVLERCVCVCVCVCVCARMLSSVQLCDPWEYSLPGSSVHGIFQAGILEQVAISSSRGSSRPRDGICISCIGSQILYHCTTGKLYYLLTS